MTETLMSITAFCKHRGLARKNFYAHYDRGAIPADCFETPPGNKRPKVIMERADRALDKNTRFNPGGEATRRKHQGEKPAPAPEAVTESEIKKYLLEDIEALKSLDMVELQKRHEIEKILAARLKRRRENDELIDRERVELAASTAGHAIKDAIQAIPHRVSPLIAATTDQHEVLQILQKETTFILSGLSEQIRRSVPPKG